MGRKEKKPKKRSASRKSSSAAAARKGAGRQGSSAPPTSTPPSQPKAPSPYDIFQNRRRRRPVLGERVPGERRNLVRSRAAAAAERTKGLIKESLASRRTSRFKDARLGVEGEDAGGLDVKFQRLVKLRQKQAHKTFALGSQNAAGLTIGGKPLSSIGDEELRADGRDADGWSGDDEAPTLDGGIDDLIAKSKLQKAEAQRMKEEQEQELGRLDKGFGEILGQLSFRPPKALQPKEPNDAAKKDPDGYDRLLKEMVFERRAMPSERVKTPEEIAREQADRLEELERARAARAAGLSDFVPAKEDTQDAGPWVFGTAAPVVEMEPDFEASKASDQEGPEEEDDDEGSEEEDEGEKEQDASAAECEEDEDDRCGEDRLALLTSAEAAKVDIMTNATGEEGLPFAPSCPTDRRAVETMIGSRPPNTALKLVQRVRTCTAVSLSTGNHSKLKAFFVALLEYVLSVVARADGDISARGLQILYALRKPLLELANEFPAQALEFFTQRLKGLGPQTLPRAAELASLKLAALLFPVTDFRHPVVTPLSLLAEHWAAQLAALGAGIAELVSDAMLLWEALYELVVPADKFCASFFSLGTALLESCWASAAAGRTQCAEASVDIAGLLAKALRALEAADTAAARVAGEGLLRPAVQRLAAEGKLTSGPARESLDTLLAELDRVRTGAGGGGLKPLTLFEAPPPQIRMLDPIFHEAGDRPFRKGMDVSETKQLRRALNNERRAAVRQLARDAGALQQLQAQKDTKRRVGRLAERKRVHTMMEVEKQELKKMMTEVDGMMDTSLHKYSAGKDRRKANKRMGGHATAETEAAKQGDLKRKAPALGAGGAPVAGERGAKAQRRRGARGPPGGRAVQKL